MAKKFSDLAPSTPQTKLLKAGLTFSEHGFVNPAVYHGSTVQFATVAALRERKQQYIYGRDGTPTHRALEEAIAEVEGGKAAFLCPSGLSAITTALLSVASAGDHILMTDSVYRPARHFCMTVLKRLGVETEFYPPDIGAGIAGLIRPNTRIVYTEQPGSQTMEIQDLPAISAAAHAAGALVMLDNTWATGRFFNAFSHGVDIVATAATKYYCGHSDVMLGAIITNDETRKLIATGHHALGSCSGPDDAYLILRGMRTLDIRLKHHMENALVVARWLQSRPEVDRILYPALPEAEGHDLWKRDFSGATGLFSVVLKPAADEAVVSMLEGLELFGMGYSWGGYESLVIPFDPSSYRSATEWCAQPSLRLHIGLEDPADLITDLTAGFERLAATC